MERATRRQSFRQSIRREELQAIMWERRTEVLYHTWVESIADVGDRLKDLAAMMHNKSDWKHNFMFFSKSFQFVAQTNWYDWELLHVLATLTDHLNHPQLQSRDMVKNLVLILDTVAKNVRIAQLLIRAKTREKIIGYLNTANTWLSTEERLPIAVLYMRLEDASTTIYTNWNTVSILLSNFRSLSVELKQLSTAEIITMTKMLIRPMFEMFEEDVNATRDIIFTIVSKTIKDKGFEATVELMEKLIEQEQTKLLVIFMQNEELKKQLKGKLEAEIDIQLMKRLFSLLEEFTYYFGKDALNFFPNYIPSIFSVLQKSQNQMLKKVALNIFNNLLFKFVKLPNVLSDFTVFLDGSFQGLELLADVLAIVIKRSPNSKEILEAGLFEQLSMRYDQSSELMVLACETIGMILEE